MKYINNLNLNDKALINLSVLEFISNITRSVLAPIFPVIFNHYKIKTKKKLFCLKGYCDII